MDDSQLLRGILEGCILSIISKEETYGYKILSELENLGFDNVFESTLYPIITRLEKKQFVCCRREKSPFGPTRKYYSITKAGEDFLSEFKNNYKKITSSAEAILFEVNHNER
ncbi:MAG: PadR family transcriptional regulator [Clostridia bacterium]|nr:PadR family transcriptional regulator [Clostridia bacterium]